jgi:pimeloyl-ACP methyl ester carboxylesterase
MLALASLGGAYETVGEALDARTYTMPGQLVDVGDHRLHVHCTGTGSPTVVLESGAGDFAATLGWIAPVVAKDTRVCVYDRAGRGWSEPADSPQDATQIAGDLRTVLRKADVPGPYVLAGHSFGGLYVLTYAANYPDDVAGMVLVDSTAPKPPSGKAATSSDLTNRVTALLSSSARLGLVRLLNQTAYDTLPPQARDEAAATGSTATTMRSTLDEYVQGNASMSEAGALTDFADKPLFVLTAGKGSSADWPAKQDRLAKLSSNSAHKVVDGAEHASFVYEKKYAAETTQAILDVVAAVRDSGAVAR